MTYLTSRCPCCAAGPTEWKTYPAVVAPFVAAYALGRKEKATRFCECENCRFRFFEDRLTTGEVERLYSGYRGEAYLAARHRYEPWYTRKVNEAIGDDQALMRTRRELVEKFVRSHADVSTLNEILDYGGDRGQFIPEGFGKDKFVYEISDVTAVPGVVRIDSVKNRTFDFVMLSHVLEHCSEPLDVLNEIKPLVRSLLYVEVPLERADLRFLGKGAIYAGWLKALRAARPLLTAVDLYSTVARTKLDAIPPLGLVKLHEHINFFDEQSLRALFDRCGLQTIAIERAVMHHSLGETPVLSALARP